MRLSRYAPSSPDRVWSCPAAEIGVRSGGGAAARSNAKSVEYTDLSLAK